MRIADIVATAIVSIILTTLFICAVHTTSYTWKPDPVLTAAEYSIYVQEASMREVDSLDD